MPRAADREVNSVLSAAPTPTTLAPREERPSLADPAAHRFPVNKPSPGPRLAEEGGPEATTRTTSAQSVTPQPGTPLWRGHGRNQDGNPGAGGRLTHGNPARARAASNGRHRGGGKSEPRKSLGGPIGCWSCLLRSGERRLVRIPRRKPRPRLAPSQLKKSVAGGGKGAEASAANRQRGCGLRRRLPDWLAPWTHPPIHPPSLRPLPHTSRADFPNALL